MKIYPGRNPWKGLTDPVEILAITSDKMQMERCYGQLIDTSIVAGRCPGPGYGSCHACPREVGTAGGFSSSAGGFLGRRNATLLIGLRPGQGGGALKALEESCRQRIEYLTLPLEGSPLPMPTPVPVTVGGARPSFALPVEHFEEF